MPSVARERRVGSTVRRPASNSTPCENLASHVLRLSAS
jgi:hypothetical protein